MPPPSTYHYAVIDLNADKGDKSEQHWDEKFFDNFWRNIADWFAKLFHGINQETLDHPYLYALALAVVWAYPHLLCLPIWFTKDAYRRADTQVRGVFGSISAPRRRKRDILRTTYRSITSAGQTPNPPRPEFGGTPLSAGNFYIEEDRDVHIVLRVIRWTALAFAILILGREFYFVLRDST
ncbi:hypothetical protein SCHPADRAFT_946734 [Schizopora paradoxa]|uniref:Uncharacterized protein n=1 Tax=Schizopora paradoxa TaxID=27342 RepID=A0A0H2R2S2_9AGAM|nr:hypothetical protein SCHPADRAFT_946734 [Schizopora paradoxa]